MSAPAPIVVRWIDGGQDPVARTGAENMALDHALLESAKAEGGIAFRLYRWRPACLSFGRNQPARGLYNVGRARARGIDFVRRPTGGQAVLHDAELTYAMALPIGVLGSPRETYAAINRGLLAGLKRLGVPATVGGAEVGRRGRPEWSAPCFAEAAPGEISAPSGKLVGSAQRREGRALLQHGSILLDGSQAPVQELLGAAGEPARPAAATIADLLGALPEMHELVRGICAGLEATLGIRLAPDGLTDAELQRARELARTYASDGWTWRR